MSKFAVFDIDGTLFRWQLFHELVVQLTIADVFPKSTFSEIDTAWNKWRGGEMSFHDYEGLVVKTLVHYLPLIPVPVYQAACDKVVAQSAHKVHFYPRKLIKDLKNEGYKIIAISGSQQEMLEPFCSRYDFDIVIGVVYEQKDGRFTGEIQRSTIGRKEVILKELIAEHDLTTEGSVAIGDSDGDIPLLSSVERPIAFDPSEGLFEHAKQSNWKIVIERKNIAYEFTQKDGELVLSDTTVFKT